MRKKKWRIAKGDRAKEKILISALGLAPVMAKLLINRGASDPAAARAIMKPSLASFEDPLKMKDMPEAVERLVKAYDENETVVIVGDYDVDGISSTALLLGFFGKIGIDARYYIPERATEGYGLGKEAVANALKEKAGLIVTVDNAITAHEAVDHANSLGVDVIVTDHHQPGESLPNALAIVNPHRSDCDYPFKELSGVGIAFKLIVALRSALHKKGIEKNRLPNLKEFLDLVAIGSIADLAPLTSENRIIVKHGLETLARTKRKGLAELMTISGITHERVTARDVAFGIAPRINAAGRLKKADVCVDLLTTGDAAQALEISAFLDSENKRRQDIQKAILAEATSMVDETCDLENDRAIVLGAKGWNPGVVGIVASKLIDKFYLPVILICFEDDIGKGSARSIKGFDLYRAISDCSAELLKFGGHPFAAGLSVGRGRFDAFREKFLTIAKERIAPEDMTPEIEIDCEVDPEIFDLDLLNHINSLEPFGHGFAHPVFISKNVEVGDVFYMGEGKRHVRLSIDCQARVIGFSYGDFFREHDHASSRFDIVYQPEINRWNGNESVQLRLIDARLSQ